jgi:hypothetical protein
MAGNGDKMTNENDKDKKVDKKNGPDELTSMRQRRESQEHGGMGIKWESRKDDYRIRTGIHAIAEKYGYRITETDGDTITFTHPNGASLQTERGVNGSWTHTDPSGKKRSGHGGEELNKELSK